jgi:hypothetical protein
MFFSILKFLIKKIARQAARQTLIGRPIKRGHPEYGRFLRHQVDATIDRALHRTEAILPEAYLQKIPTTGNRQNVLLSALTIGAFQALCEAGIEKHYAIELFSDLGWALYRKLLILPKMLARIATRDPQKRINLILKIFMLYPFSRPGAPGYDCTTWAEADRCCTYWRNCPPLEFVRYYLKSHADRGEMEVFRRSWCEYDWALTYAMVDGGYMTRGHYERPHTMSAGDAICDMQWYAEIPQKVKCRKKAIEDCGHACQPPSHVQSDPAERATKAGNDNHR